MCGRYTIVAKADEIAERFSVEVLPHYQAHYNAAPTHLLPIITSDSPGGISTFYWGLPPALSNNKVVSERIINMPSETVLTKPVFRRALQNRRCLVPADGFYEWKKIGKKTTTPYRFTKLDRTLFSFAGIWEQYEDVSGTAYHTFSIFTTTPNEIVASIHDRMPVMLSAESEKIWMDSSSNEMALINLLKPFPASQMDAYTVSPRVNSILNDSPTLILPAPPQDQHGNLTLFG